ncbi:MAG TPA: hypothetical protein VKH43_05870 [Thermoanaerobaculia bacterium]|nr:hypothetical protein [Thermoanaerobaculia bacterium]
MTSPSGDPRAGGPRWLRAALLLAAAAVFGVSVLVGVRAFRADLRLAFQSAPLFAIPPEIESQVSSLRARIPRGESLLYIGNRTPPDTWFSRLWQRAFYPTRVVIFELEKSPVKLDLPSPARNAGLEELKKLYNIRYAICAGNPPTDPGLRSHSELAAIPGYPYQIWFGELSP